MKAILFLIALLNSCFAFSQCLIAGSDQIQVGERKIYEADETESDCNDCYQWTYHDQKVLLETDTHRKQITLKGAVPGEAVLFLEISTKEGNQKCQKSVNVISPTTNLIAGDAAKCKIAVEAFKETRIKDNVVQFEPEIADDQSTFLWTVTYRNGSKKTSADRKATFDYSMQNVINEVELKVKVDLCSKKISKTYDTNFWYFF